MTHEQAAYDAAFVRFMLTPPGHPEELKRIHELTGAMKAAGIPMRAVLRPF